MAKSKTGGSRAYIRGRIGSDVYSVGKDGKGMRQQVVRSLAEQVSNPRTQEQMFGRMIMSTVMQAVSAMAPIIDHSFDGIAKGQPSISEFIRQNYALVKADAIAHPASDNKFDLSKYQEKGIKTGTYIVSKGSAVLPAAVKPRTGYLYITLPTGAITVAGLKQSLGLSADGYLTWVGIAYGVGFQYLRLKLTTTLADSTAITAQNVGSLFTLEGNVTATASLSSLGDDDAVCFQIGDGDGVNNQAVIVSEKVNGAWIHNDAQLDGEGVAAYTADVALPTYPTGTTQFLNGGDL